MLHARVIRPQIVFEFGLSDSRPTKFALRYIVHQFTRPELGWKPPNESADPRQLRLFEPSQSSKTLFFSSTQAASQLSFIAAFSTYLTTGLSRPCPSTGLPYHCPWLADAAIMKRSATSMYPCPSFTSVFPHFIPSKPYIKRGRHFGGPLTSTSEHEQAGMEKRKTRSGKVVAGQCNPNSPSNQIQRPILDIENLPRPHSSHLSCHPYPRNG